MKEGKQVDFTTANKWAQKEKGIHLYHLQLTAVKPIFHLSNTLL